ncbi:MAG: hypothetical protein ACJ79R_06195 [Anaeromyxobacteraceae bacterium]
MIGLLVARARAALGRALLGVSAEEIRYTFEDVRREIHATRTELLGEIASLRADLDATAGQAGHRDEKKPVAEA